MNEAGVRRWGALEGRLPELLAELCAARPVVRGRPGAVPARPGVYLFTEDGTHVYVGQTRNLRAG